MEFLVRFKVNQIQHLKNSSLQQSSEASVISFYFATRKTTRVERRSREREIKTALILGLVSSRDSM